MDRVCVEKSMTDMIDMRNVSYRYEEDGRDVLQNINLTVHSGEFVCVLGHNGCGKSTLAKLMNGLFQPTAGTVLVSGMDTRSENDIFRVRACAGMVFQNPDNQTVATVVEEDVAFGPENIGVPQKELRDRVDRALAAVGMSAYAKKEPHRLSGGQKQRVAIAGVLAMEPKLLILDEATAMLDPRGREEVLSTVKKLNREKQITVVWITHFMEETVEADRLLIMDQGRICLEGTPRELFAHTEDLRALKLETPPAAQIAQTLREHGIDVPNDILTPEELTDALWAFRSKT